ncbi:MAG: hypothetical protein O3A47_10570 [Chloroflexi bacterium]|nr:hypothetical protein [Chloroflexota bacterium]
MTATEALVGQARDVARMALVGVMRRKTRKMLRPRVREEVVAADKP